MRHKIKIVVILLIIISLLAGCATSVALEDEQPSTEGSKAANPATTPLATTPDSSTGETEKAASDFTSDAYYEDEIFGNDIITINITAEAEDWAYLMENAIDKPYISADVIIDGVVFEDVGIKTKGNSTLSETISMGSERFSLKLNFDKYLDEQSCYGLDKLVLNNIAKDTTYLKEYLSYELFDYMDVPASLYTFAEITVNGEYYGFFVALEDVDSDLFDRVYGEDNDGEAYKPDGADHTGDDNVVIGMNNMPGQDPTISTSESSVPPTGATAPTAPPTGAAVPNAPTAGTAIPTAPTGQMQQPSGKPPIMGGKMPTMNDGVNNMPVGAKGTAGLGVNLVYTGDDLSSYSNIFDNEVTNTNEVDHARVVASLKTISEGEDLEQVIDVDELLRYTAVNVFLVNLDSYFSTMGHNYILYEEDGQLSMIPWDYNESFGTHQVSSASMAINYAIDTVFNGVDAEERPIIGLLLENEAYLAKYHEYLAEIVEYVTSQAYHEKFQDLVDLIDPYVQNDTTSFSGYSSFLTGVRNLESFIALRAESVNGQLDGSIPSTTEEQLNSSNLVDAGSFNLSALGGANSNTRGR